MGGIGLIAISGVDLVFWSFRGGFGFYLKCFRDGLGFLLNLRGGFGFFEIF